MITRIKEMHNLGRYENFIGNQEIGKQQIIFGFNGSGKSTLSDMFYWIEELWIRFQVKKQGR